jgi:23S rRNA (adenine2503-C2)-methyltransferase
MSFEWALIDGVNDRAADAVELAALCRRLRPAAHVNLIPLNPTPGWPTRGSPRSKVVDFRDRLHELGVAVTVRRNRGTDIDAACGQLAATTPVGLSERVSFDGQRGAPCADGDGGGCQAQATPMHPRGRRRG